MLQRFECCIIEVDDENSDITVLMEDLTHDNPDEYATIAKERFTEDQQLYLITGHVFLWEITELRGLVQSTFTFRPLQVFTQYDIDQASIKAQQFCRLLIPEPLDESFSQDIQDHRWVPYES